MKEILGPIVPAPEREKTARKHKDGVQPGIFPISKHIQDYYQEIILAIDIMHVNQIPFLIMTSRHIHYYTANVFPSMNGDIIVFVL